MLLLLSLLFVGGLSSEVYTSFNNVKNLNYIENHLTKLLRKYIDREKARIETLEAFYKYVMDGKGDIDADLYIAYPTNQFNVIHRFVTDWSNLEKYYVSNNNDINTAYTMYRGYFPDEDDIKGAAKALHRLQDIYKITAGHFARGEPLENGTLFGQPLNVKALMVLTSNSYSQNDWAKCAGWAQQAYALMEKNGDFMPDSGMWFDVTDHLSYCLFKIGKLEYAMEVTNTMLEHYPTHERLLGNKKYFYDELQKKLYGETNYDVEEGSADVDVEEEGKVKRSVISEPLPFLGEITVKEDVNITFVPKVYPGADKAAISEEEMEDVIQDKEYQRWPERIKKYKSLCKDAPALSPEMKEQLEQLTCYYKADTPRSHLKPIKVEVAWPSPRILIFHDIISEDEAVRLQKLAEPLLNRATVHNKETGKLENAEYRISKTAWLDVDLPQDKQHIVRRVNRRMEDATELSMELAELQQVNNYGMGGQYEPHYDMATKDEKAFEEHEGGNRVATLLFYMGITEAGGATVFLDAGVRLPPIKNAAVFWYNLLPNGDPDLLTRHAGCPVLAGTKWVMNKWVHVNDQMFIRPCDIDRYKREKPAKLRNGKYTV